DRSRGHRRVQHVKNFLRRLLVSRIAKRGNAEAKKKHNKKATEERWVLFHDTRYAESNLMPCRPRLQSKSRDDSPPGLGVRQPSGAFGGCASIESARGLAHSTTLPRHSTRRLPPGSPPFTFG